MKDLDPVSSIKQVGVVVEEERGGAGRGHPCQGLPDV